MRARLPLGGREAQPAVTLSVSTKVVAVFSMRVIPAREFRRHEFRSALDG